MKTRAAFLALSFAAGLGLAPAVTGAERSSLPYYQVDSAGQVYLWHCMECDHGVSLKWDGKAYLREDFMPAEEFLPSEELPPPE